MGRGSNPAPAHVWSALALYVIRALMTADQFKREMIGLLPRLRRFALSLTRSGPDADDLLQETCTAALQRWTTYDPAQPFERWLFRVMRNQWFDETRKRNVREGRGTVAVEDAPQLREESRADSIVAARQLCRKVEDLPVELSRPLMLVCAEGYSYREVSDLLEIPVGTVMSRIHRARKLLAEGLTEEECVVS